MNVPDLFEHQTSNQQNTRSTKTNGNKNKQAIQSQNLSFWRVFSQQKYNWGCNPLILTFDTNFLGRPSMFSGNRKTQTSECLVDHPKKKRNKKQFTT